jgi:2,5-diamino-6-(ribosylamino)-4(3H)-pyrimidinone 5'-phosphate reductase
MSGEDEQLPYVVVHVAVSLDAATTGFEPDLGVFYGLAQRWKEDVTLAGADTILAQESALAQAPPGPGPDPSGPLLAVVDSRERVSQWEALRSAGHWRDAVPLRGDSPGGRVDLRRALAGLAEQGASVVRVDSGGGLTGALLADGLVNEISLLVHPVLVGEASAQRWYGAVQPSVRPELEPLEHEALDGGLAWLRYRCR